MIVAIAFLTTLVSLKLYIKLARRLGIGQLIKKDGPDLHGYKEGTPTMGGVVFIPILLVVLMISRAHPLITLSTFLFFIVGLLDDLSSLLKKDAYGMSAKFKFSLQVISASVAFALFPIVHDLKIPLTHSIFDLGVFYPIFAVFLVVGVSNAVNLTDGLDGLAGWVFVTGVISMYALLKDHMLLPVVAIVIAFLMYNSKPASVFMGDSGALALGAFLASYSIVKGVELYLIFFGFIFFVETLSVIIQVVSFKTRGRRVFKMAPLHHHFELSGWRGEKIVFVFSGLNLISSLVVLWGM